MKGQVGGFKFQRSGYEGDGIQSNILELLHHCLCLAENSDLIYYKSISVQAKQLYKNYRPICFELELFKTFLTVCQYLSVCLFIFDTTDADFTTVAKLT